MILLVTMIHDHLHGHQDSLDQVDDHQDHHDHYDHLSHIDRRHHHEAYLHPELWPALESTSGVMHVNLSRGLNKFSNCLTSKFDKMPFTKIIYRVAEVCFLSRSWLVNLIKHLREAIKNPVKLTLSSNFNMSVHHLALSHHYLSIWL